MTTFTPEEIVERGRTLVGAKFRPQGRDPAIGLDCVGVVLWVFGIPQDLVRRDYRLRGARRGEVEIAMQRWFGPLDPHQLGPGDVALFDIRERQSHLAISSDRSLIHADASLRKVVEVPMPARWPLTAAFRSRSLAHPD
jgi:cell wall-associated NlpC family hydrolase